MVRAAQAPQQFTVPPACAGTRVYGTEMKEVEQRELYEKNTQNL